MTHANTDFDALGAMVAARRLYPGATPCLQGGLNRNVREFLALAADELGTLDLRDVDLSAVERVIVVETSHLGRLGEAADVIGRDGVETVLFDHHGDPTPDWVAPGCHVTSGDGALTSTMVGILAERGIEPTPTEATALALGIHEDTGSLTFPSTTLRDVEALAFCARHGASQDLISMLLHTPLGADERALVTTLLDAAETVDVAGTGVLVAAVSWPRYMEGVSTLAGTLVELSECQALLMLVEMDGRVFAVGRSRTPAIDVGQALEALGGGGHHEAASGIVRGRTLADARAAGIEALRAAAAGAPRAADLMASPPWLVDEDVRIDEAIEQCRRRRTSGILVAAGGRLVGTAALGDLDRAVAHRLAHAPVRAVMTAHVDTVTMSAPLGDVQRAVVRSPGGRVPVVRDGHAGDDAPPLAAVVGVVTRGAVLQTLRAREARPAAGAAAAPPPAPPGDIAERLRRLPGLERLWTAIEAASGEDRPYLVGGAVRDLLLGEPSFDVDLAVEGDGVAFAERLAGLLGGRMHAHEKFHTAAVLTEEARVDVATARTEHYEHPAALPTVERSTLRQDLFRRDFTVNAMAVALWGDRFGDLVDPFGGLADLRAGVVRVLHPLSFIDDPTRIFRAIRYENRYGFRMNRHTLGLARSCVEMGLVGDLSGARVRDELVAILEEHEVDHSLARLCELELGSHIQPGIDCGPDAAALARRVEDLRVRHAGRLARWRLRLAVLGLRLTGDELLGWLERLRIRRRDAATIADAAVVGPRLAARLAGAATPADAAALLSAHPLESAVIAAAVAEAPAADRAVRYLAELRHVSLEIDGLTLREQLGMEESPRIGEVLAEVLRRKWNGELRDRDDELRAARELVDGARAGARG